MHAAADRCQRIGACRKTGQGVMCPSYMATREEEHATRGRANALVKALSASPTPPQALGDERLHEILDLCLECKACKSECPLSVDMATLKSEFLSQHNAIHGTPLRSRLFGAIRTLNRLGAATAPLSNKLPVPMRLLGLAPRPRPRFERETLIRWDRKRPRKTGTPGDLPRRLASRRSPSRASAAPRSSCSRPRATTCGSSTPAAAGARRSPRACSTTRRAKAEALTERLQGDELITGCEPSCLLTLREEHVALLGDRGVASRTRLVEELLLDADLPLQAGPKRILFHGHCHQKALAGTSATVALLQQDPGRRGRRARRRLLRHGRVLRLRERALRAVHAHRRDAPVPRGPERARGHGDRGHRHVMPPADRARDREARAPPRADRAGRTHRERANEQRARNHLRPDRDLRDRHAAAHQHGPARHHGRVPGRPELRRVRGRHPRRLPRRAVHHPRRRHLPVRDRQQQRHRGLARPRGRARGRRARRADPVGDVPDHRDPHRLRLGRPGRGGDRRADRPRVRRPLQDQPGPDGPADRQRRDRRRLLPDQHLRRHHQRRRRGQQPRRQPGAAVRLELRLQRAAERRRLLHVRRPRPAAAPHRHRPGGDRALQARDDRERPAGDRRRRGRHGRRGARR